MSEGIITVAVQGAAGSYHEQAAYKYFGVHCQVVYCQTFEEVFEHVKNGWVTHGLIAGENSIYGKISEVQTLLEVHGQKVQATGKTSIPIHHCLIGLPGARMENIASVHSQYMALGQCGKFLGQHLPGARLVSQPDTAASLGLIQKWQDSTAAAIASAEAAKIYNLPILWQNIEDDPSNRTTFVVIQKVLVRQTAPVAR